MGLFDGVTDFLGLTGGDKSIKPPDPITAHYQAQQDELVNQYKDIAEGRSPSLAEALANQQKNQYAAQQMSMAGTARGANNPFALRSAMNATAQQNQMLSQNALVGKLQEREAAK